MRYLVATIGLVLIVIGMVTIATNISIGLCSGLAIGGLGLFIDGLKK